jgi:hypothetical protein
LVEGSRVVDAAAGPFAVDPAFTPFAAVGWFLEMVLCTRWIDDATFFVVDQR